MQAERGMTTNSVTPYRRELTRWLVMAFAAIWAAVAIVIIFNAGKLTAIAVLSMTLFPLVLYLSGNPRLFLLFGLVCAAPLGLSLNFGRIIHIGGSPSFSIDLMDFFLIPLLMFLARDYSRGYRSDFRLPPVALIWLGMILLGTLSVVLGPYHTISAFEVARMLKHLLLFLVIVNECVRVKHFEHVLYALLTGVSLQILIGIAQFTLKRDLGLQALGEAAPDSILGANLGVYLTEGAVYRIGGLMGHPNLLAAYLALLLPIFLASTLSSYGGKVKTALIVVSAMGLIELVLTLSRSGWAAFAAAFACLLIITFTNRYIRTRFFVAKVSLAIASFMGLILGSGPVLRRILQSDSGALDFRWEWMGVAWRMVEARPFLGFGLNTFEYQMVPYTPEQSVSALLDRFGEVWPPVHNIYLLIWAEQGTLGFLLFAAFHVAVLMTALRNLRTYVNDKLFAMNVGCLCGFVALMVDGMASFFMRVPGPGRIYWLIVALIVAIRYWNRYNTPSRQIGRATNDVGGGSRDRIALGLPSAPT